MDRLLEMAKNGSEDLLYDLEVKKLAPYLKRRLATTLIVYYRTNRPVRQVFSMIRILEMLIPDDPDFKKSNVRAELEHYLNNKSPELARFLGCDRFLPQQREYEDDLPTTDDEEDSSTVKTGGGYIEVQPCLKCVRRLFLRYLSELKSKHTEISLISDI